jgi:hypothetical protein
VQRAVLEAKDQPTLDAITVGGLKEIAVSHGLAAHRANEKQAVGGSLDEPHLDGRSLEARLGREAHEDGQNTTPEKRHARALYRGEGGGGTAINSLTRAILRRRWVAVKTRAGGCRGGAPPGPSR